MCDRRHSRIIIYMPQITTLIFYDNAGCDSKKFASNTEVRNIRQYMCQYRLNVSLILHCTALKHHAAGTEWSLWQWCWCWVPVSWRYTVDVGCRTNSEPPTAALSVGAVSMSPLVVVYVRRTEWHSVWLPGHCVIIVKGVSSVAMVAGHVQRVVVVLWFDGHVVVLRPQPLTTRLYLHFHT